MTTQKVFDIFSVLQDKYGAPYIDDSWKVDMFNMSQNEYLHDLLPEEGGEGVNFDFDSNVTNNLQPLIWTVTPSTNSSGLLTESALDTAIQTASSDSTAKLFRVMSIGITSSGKTYPVRYVKQNNLQQYAANIFKAPSSPTKVKYNFVGGGLQFYPQSTITGLTITVIKTPRNIAIAPATPVDPEWSDYVCYNLIAKMLKLAGITTDSAELIQDVRLAAVAQ